MEIPATDFFADPFRPDHEEFLLSRYDSGIHNVIQRLSPATCEEVQRAVSISLDGVPRQPEDLNHAPGTEDNIREGYRTDALSETGFLAQPGSGDLKTLSFRVLQHITDSLFRTAPGRPVVMVKRYSTPFDQARQSGISLQTHSHEDPSISNDPAQITQAHLIRKTTQMRSAESGIRVQQAPGRARKGEKHRDSDHEDQGRNERRRLQVARK